MSELTDIIATFQKASDVFSPIGTKPNPFFAVSIQ